MNSTLFELYERRKRAEWRAEWRAEGRAEEARTVCVTLTRAFHPAVAPRLVPVIKACSVLPQLRRWTARAPRLSDAEFASLITGRRAAGPARRRAPRPARKATHSGGR